MPTEPAKETSSGPIPDPEAMDAFLKFFQNEIRNPPKVSELFKIPTGLAPDWQRIFDKVAAHYERECTANRHHLISLEKRSWIMEDEKLTEFEMVMSSVKIKQNGNDEFRQRNFDTALMSYISAIQAFPTPDVMNNIAACALQLARFDLAEEYTTKALDMDLFTNQSSIVKAFFRRSSARFHMGNFAEASKDCEAALTFNPNEPSISDLMTEICETMKTVDTDTKLAAYLDEQPKPAVQMPLIERLPFIQDQLNIDYIRIPENVQGHLGVNVEAPTF